MNAAIALFIALSAAPRLPYGDRLEAVFWGGALPIDPARSITAADLTFGAAVFEGLYTLDPKGELVPALASALPVSRGDRWIIPLGDVVLHDGRRLTADHVAAELLRWADPRSPAAHVVLAIDGGRERLSGQRDRPLGIEVLAGENAIALKIAEPHPAWLRAFAGGRAALSFAPEKGGAIPIGSGPFRIESYERDGGAVLSAFSHHRRGRPYFDGLRLQPANAPFGSAARLGRGDVDLLIDVPEKNTAALELSSNCGAPSTELLFLAVGDRLPALRTTALLRAMDAAIGRDRLARRYAGDGARAAETLTGFRAEQTMITLPNTSERLHATLLVPRRYAAERRFAERVQLDLLRAGITATIETLEDSAIEARKKSGDFELMLDRFLLEGSAKEDGSHHLHGLISLAAARNVLPAAVTPDDLAALSGASAAEQTRVLAAIDRKVRDEARILPIVHRPSTAWISRTLVGAKESASGAVLLEDAFFSEAHRR